jgi:hypothetical protein
MGCLRANFLLAAIVGVALACAVSAGAQTTTTPTGTTPTSTTPTSTTPTTTSTTPTTTTPTATTTTPEDEEEAGPSILAAKTMRIRVVNATQENLVVVDRTLEKGHWRGAGPVGARPLHVADFVMESESLKAKGDTRWRIGDSDYLLKVWGNVDSPSSNCAIQTMDRKDTSDSPYSCSQHLTGGDDSDQYTVVQPKEARETTDVIGQQRRAVYEALCGTEGVGATGYASCEIDPINIDNGLGPVRAAGDILANCGVSKAELDVSGSYTQAQVNTVGGSIGLEFETPGKAFSARVDFTSEWNQTAAATVTAGTKLDLLGRNDDGEYLFGWMETRPQVQIARTNIVATVGNQRFNLPNVDVIGPLASSQGAGTGVGRSAVIPAGFCEGTSRVALEQRVPTAELDTDEVYTLGIRGANQRVIAVPGDTKTTGTRLQLAQYAPANAGQRWLLHPVAGYDGYYQVRSDNELDLCLDQWVGTDTVLQHTCKADTAGDIGNQLWRLDYGTTNESFQLVSKANEKVVGVDGTGAGAQLSAVTSGTSGFHTLWELNPVSPEDTTENATANHRPHARKAKPKRKHHRRHRKPHHKRAAPRAAGPTAVAAGHRTIRFRVLNATDLDLSVHAETTSGAGSWREQPSGGGSLHVADFTATGSADVGGWIQYRLGDSGFFVIVQASNPAVGSNSTECRVVDSLGVGDRYACTAEHSSANYDDMNAFFVIQPKEAATHEVDVRDGARRLAVLDALCGNPSEMRNESCELRTIDDVSYGLAPPVPQGMMVVNCGLPGTTLSPSQSETQTSGTSWSVGVSVEAKKTLGAGFKAVAKTYYKHTWSETHATTLKYSIAVPAYHYGWIERATPVANVRADYVVTAGNQTFVIPQVTMTAPATGARQVGVVIGRTYPIPDPETACRDGSVNVAVPKPPIVGGTFVIGLDGMNQRVIAASGGQGAVTLAKAKTGDPTQQWEFSELPGREGAFQIRNVANGNLCLDQDLGAGGLIAYPCWAEPADNQLWHVALDPARNSYQITSLTNDYGVEAGSGEDGAAMRMVSAPSTALGRWEFQSTGA